MREWTVQRSSRWLAAVLADTARIQRRERKEKHKRKEKKKEKEEEEEWEEVEGVGNGFIAVVVAPRRRFWRREKEEEERGREKKEKKRKEERKRRERGDRIRDRGSPASVAWRLFSIIFAKGKTYKKEFEELNYKYS